MTPFRPHGLQKEPRASVASFHPCPPSITPPTPRACPAEGGVEDPENHIMTGNRGNGNQAGVLLRKIHSITINERGLCHTCPVTDGRDHRLHIVLPLDLIEFNP